MKWLILLVLVLFVSGCVTSNSEQTIEDEAVIGEISDVSSDITDVGGDLSEIITDI
jgi:outer membrane lipoprotein-sorting protein